nr:hypothetical protein [Tanacetum cinerariifolium]
MAIPKEMMSDKIKASVDYSNYLAKSMGIQPIKGRGKWLITKKEGVNMETDKETLDHLIMKLKGVKNVSSTAKFLIDMKKARKSSKDDFIIQQRPKCPVEGAIIVLNTPDEPSDSSSSSHLGSDDEEGFL